MIQRQKKNPCSILFQENPFQLKIQYYIDQVVCSLHKNLLGIYYYGYNTFRCFNRYKGEIIIFALKEEKWEEYFRMEIQYNNDIQLIFFVNQNNDFQLLFHKQGTDCIEILTANQNNIFGLYSYLSGTIKVYFKLPANVEQMLPSKNQKMILIQIPRKFLLLDAIQKIIILTLDKDNERLYYNLGFFNNTYLIQTQSSRIKNFEQASLEAQILVKEKIQFYNIKNKHAEKVVYIYFNTYFQDYFYNLSKIQQINEKSYCFFCFGSPSKQTIVILNMVNFKFIRKINLTGGLRFKGFSERQALYSILSNNRVQIYVIDLFNLNIEISDLNSDLQQHEIGDLGNYCLIKFDNELLMVENPRRQEIQIWFTK